MLFSFLITRRDLLLSVPGRTNSQTSLITQNNLFGGNFVGLGPDSHDLEFPNFSKIANAFDIPYFGCRDKRMLNTVLNKFLDLPGCAMFEVFCDTNQIFEPKSATRKLKDGSLYSPPLEDLYPFLDRNEFKKNMYIKTIDE